MTREPDWLTLARELQAIAQTGLAFSKDVYDLQRFARVRELAAALIAGRSNMTVESLLNVFERDAGYATPKVDVRGAAFKDGRILMVREASDGGWALPGGWADVNQSPAECVEREILEESGFIARAVKLIAVNDYRKAGYPKPHVHSIYKMFFLCELTGGAPRPSEETTAVDFFDRAALPALSPGRINAAQIERVFRHRESPGLATEFD